MGVGSGRGKVFGRKKTNKYQFRNSDQDMEQELVHTPGKNRGAGLQGRAFVSENVRRET